MIICHSAPTTLRLQMEFQRMKEEQLYLVQEQRLMGNKRQIVRKLNRIRCMNATRIIQ